MAPSPVFCDNCGSADDIRGWITHPADGITPSYWGRFCMDCALSDAYRERIARAVGAPANEADNWPAKWGAD